MCALFSMILSTLYLWPWCSFFAHSSSVTHQSLTVRVGGAPVRLAAGPSVYSSFIKLPVVLSGPWNLHILSWGTL